MSEMQPLPIDPKHMSLLWAGPDDALEISRMHADTQRSPWSEDSVRDLLANPCSSALIVKIRLLEGNHPAAAGFIMGQIAGDAVEVLSIGVLPPFRRFGLGQALVEGLIRAAQRAEAERVTLEVGIDNAPANGLYETLGFVEVGRRKDYYKNSDGTSVDALILVRDIESAG